MFSARDISTVAAQIEQNGERFYRRVQRKVTDGALKDLLGWLADEEKRHAQWFSSLSDTMPLAPQNSKIEEIGRALLQDSVSDQTFSLDESNLINADGLNRICEYAIEFEKDTIIFYEMLRDFIEAEEALMQLESIINEEKQHVVQLANLIKAPVSKQ
jgi:rubrerythrin